MFRRPFTFLVARALWELVRFDLVMSLSGFEGIHGGLSRLRPAAVASPPDAERTVTEALRWAAALYWKRIRCLQRSTVLVRLLRHYGQHAVLVIGCRQLPFLAHAWVELDGRVIGDSPAYQRKLCVLDRA